MVKKVLVADDEDDIRDLVLMTLEEEGYQLFEARDGNEALDKALEVKPDLLVLDVMMPGKVGYEVCEALKKNPDTKDVFVLFLSSRTSPSSESSAMMAGGDAWMFKPFEPAELRQKVKKALGLA